jgi:hypothetical protein
MASIDMGLLNRLGNTRIPKGHRWQRDLG